MRTLCGFAAAKAKSLSIADRWLLSRPDHSMTACERSNQQYDFGLSTQSVYHVGRRRRRAAR